MLPYSVLLKACVGVDVSDDIVGDDGSVEGGGLQKPEVLPVMRIDHCSENVVVGYCFCGGLRWASDGLPKIGHVCFCYRARQGYINPL